MDDYEKLVEVYQAQNAVQIARSVGADRYAADTFAKAEQLLHTAQEYQARKVDRSAVVTAARQAAQTAEDARTIAVQRMQTEQLSQAKAESREAQEAREKAEREAQIARSQASADRMQLEQERTARAQAEAAAAAAARCDAAPPPVPAPSVTVEVAPPAPGATDRQKTEMRVRLLQELNGALTARDTPRGLVVTVPETDFRGAMLDPAISSRLARLASVLAANPDQW